MVDWGVGGGDGEEENSKFTQLMQILRLASEFQLSEY